MSPLLALGTSIVVTIIAALAAIAAGYVALRDRSSKVVDRTTEGYRDLLAVREAQLADDVAKLAQLQKEREALLLEMAALQIQRDLTPILNAIVVLTEEIRGLKQASDERYPAVVELLAEITSTFERLNGTDQPKAPGAP